MLLTCFQYFREPDSLSFSPAEEESFTIPQREFIPGINFELAINDVEIVAQGSWKWGHVSSGSMKYYYEEREMSYTEAATFCADNSAYLAEVASDDDRDWDFLAVS